MFSKGIFLMGRQKCESQNPKQDVKGGGGSDSTFILE